MNLNKKNIGTILVLMATAAFLAAAVILLTLEKKENGDTIARLKAQVNQLEKGLSLYKGLHEKQKKEQAFRQFKDNAFRLRHPDFAETVKIVYKKSKQYGFNPYLVMALIQVESAFDQYAVSTAGAFGLMQVNYAVWKDELNIDWNRIFDKEYNVDLGLRILRHYHDKSAGNMFTALFRYNNGYKYNNTRYNGRIIATRFYAHREQEEKPKVTEGQEKVSI